MKHHKRYYILGFSLIELLVVIAIVGLLAALLLANFMGARERARDNQRKSDLKQLQAALELYKQDQNPIRYPAALPSPGSCWTSTTEGGGGVPVVEGVTESNCPPGNVYMKKVPGDPNRTPSNYYYLRNASDYLKYTLCACLENKGDAAAEDGSCDVSYVCSSGKKYTVTEP